MLDEPSCGEYWITDSIKDKSFEDFYTFGPELGRGVTSVVYKCSYNGTGEAWAVKVISKKTQKLPGQKDIGLLLRLNHPNLIRLKESFETPSKIYLVLELAKGGDLFTNITSRGHYSEKDASKVIRDLLEGLLYLHSNGVVHRNLKPENLLLEDNRDIPRLKIADFGLSQIQERDVQTSMACGSPGYNAPEMLVGSTDSFASDIWTCGVVAFILLSGQEPFYETDVKDTYKRIIKTDYNFDLPAWENVSENAKDFVRKALQKNGKCRINSEQALRHPWVKGVAARSEHMASAQEELKEFLSNRKLVSLTNQALLGAWTMRDIADE